MTRTRFSTVPRIRRPLTSTSIIPLCAGLGVAIGLAVLAIQGFVVGSQRALLGFAAEHRIALPELLPWWRVLIALSAGALLLSVGGRLLARFRVRTAEPIDAVQANALQGGRMDWRDGVAVVLPIMVSVCVGASVGTEAAVTQIGAVLASRIGQRLRFPRSDLRILVGAGAAAAISAAYHAPFAGMLYAFELVLGSYTKRMLPAVAVAAIAAAITVWQVDGQERPFSVELTTSNQPSDYVLAIGIGGLAALAGIAIMMLVTILERALRRVSTRSLVRRFVAAITLAALSRRFPSVLGSGHGAVEHTLRGDLAGPQALMLLGAKGLASSVSIAAGFRGGLFSASLLVGALLGQIIAWLPTFVPWIPALKPEFCSLVGMAAVGASVIGAPLAFLSLVLETTGDFTQTAPIALGAVVASFLTDRLFGYSFATWRFQQRGLAIEGGHDIGRLDATPIASLIRAPKRTVTADATLDVVLRAVSVAGGRGTAVYDLDGSFVGLLDPALVEVMADEGSFVPIVAAEMVHATTPTVTPDTTLAELIAIFRADDRPTLPVVNATNMRELVGCVRARDAYALSSSVLDAQRRDELGLRARDVDSLEPHL